MSEKKGIVEEFGMTEEELIEVEKKYDEEQEIEEKRREEMKEKAPSLTKLFLAGKKFRTQEAVKMKDGSYYKLTLKPLNDDEIYEAMDEVGIEKVPNLRRRDVRVSEIKMFRWAISLAKQAVELPSGVSWEDLKEAIAYGELTRLGTDILLKLFSREAVETDKADNMDATAGFT